MLWPGLKGLSNWVWLYFRLCNMLVLRNLDSKVLSNLLRGESYSCRLASDIFIFSTICTFWTLRRFGLVTRGSESWLFRPTELSIDSVLPSRSRARSSVVPSMDKLCTLFYPFLLLVCTVFPTAVNLVSCISSTMSPATFGIWLETSSVCNCVKSCDRLRFLRFFMAPDESKSWLRLLRPASI